MLITKFLKIEISKGNISYYSKKLICEIKSKYYYNKYLSLNNSKMISTKSIGYRFEFIIDKDYSILNNYIN